MTCDLGTVAKGSRATINVRVRTGAPGPISNVVQVFGDEGDPNTANNQDTETTTVQ